MKIKRYQKFTRTGVGWSNWFPCDDNDDEKWQMKNHLLNEYKVVDNTEWEKIKKEQTKK